MQVTTAAAAADNDGQQAQVYETKDDDAANG